MTAHPRGPWKDLMALHDAMMRGTGLNEGACGCDFTWEVSGVDIDPDLALTSVRFLAAIPASDASVVRRIAEGAQLKSKVLTALQSELDTFGLRLVSSKVTELAKQLSTRIEVVCAGTPEDGFMPYGQLSHIDLQLEHDAVHPVYFLGPYYPVSDPQHAKDRFSQQIISLKRGTPSAVDYFEKLLERHIPSDAAIAVVPGHNAGEAHGGLRTLAQRLCRGGRFDATAAFVRTKPVQQSSTAKPGERPTAEVHRDSITADRNLLSGRAVWILDDIVTRGASMRACRWLALDKKHGQAKSVTLLALGRTTRTPPVAPAPHDVADDDIPF